MKYLMGIVMAGVMIGVAYYNAQSKIHHTLNLEAVRLGMNVSQIEKSFGVPSSRDRNQLTYIFDDSSVMVLTLRDDKVASATVKFHKPMKITDPEMRKLTLVQMESESLMSDEPSWFFAGKPEEGLIYKITAQGVIESLTWIPPFSYPQNQPKQLQALLQDFRSRQVTNL
jgi:hypothetical protein